MFLLVFEFLHVIVTVDSKVNQKQHSDAFAIFTKGCIIPTFPLVSENIQNFVGFPKKAIDCSNKYPGALLKSNESHIWIENNVLEQHNIMEKNKFFCCYYNFYANKSVEDIFYGSCVQFSDTIEALHEFVRVECFYLDDKVYDDFFVFPMRIQTVPMKNYKNFNVIIFGLESVSRMNFLRTMPATANFLRGKGSIQLLGYNKLGDNSFPNLFPLLLGKSFKDALSYCTHGNDEIDTIKCAFIWDRFKKSGYVTALGSDSIAGLLGNYEYSLSKLPTDYYLQPFMSESIKLFKNKEYSYHMCYKNKFYYKTLLNYVYHLSNKLKDNNLFGIFWEESVSHEHLNYPHIMDAQYLNLLEKLEISGYLNESVLIFFSDHGMRWGNIVLTEQGRLEERLPLVEILLPPKFKEVYKLAHENLKINSHRLTTPYDMYDTLADLVDPTLLHDHELRRRNKNRMYDNRASLFLPLSENRTCDFVGISDHWCTCHKGMMLPTGHKNRLKASRFLIDYINSLMITFPQCYQLSVKNIFDVSVVMDPRGSTYRVAIEAFPGGGIFDATLRMERGVFAVSGTISRLNLYRGQGDCVQDDSLKMYCYCRQPFRI
ncbi:hypothetical protein ABMA27_013464 [Loxostege sticticalis]|uniref:Uncharacterized protein n=1 Tax=Loxostege sticticalis TaxID=481309 RepID=A0ABR3IFF0_LOXSC